MEVKEMQGDENGSEERRMGKEDALVLKKGMKKNYMHI